MVSNRYLIRLAYCREDLSILFLVVLDPLITISALDSTTNMKIAIVIERADIALGGAERSALELAAALQSLGLDAHVLAAKGKTDAKNIHILCGDILGKRRKSLRHRS